MPRSLALKRLLGLAERARLREDRVCDRRAVRARLGVLGRDLEGPTHRGGLANLHRHLTACRPTRRWNRAHVASRSPRLFGPPASPSLGHPRAAIPISADTPAPTPTNVDLEQRRQARQVDIELDSLRSNAAKSARIVTLRRRLEERRRAAAATTSRCRPNKELPSAPVDEIDRVR